MVTPAEALARVKTAYRKYSGAHRRWMAEVERTGGFFTPRFAIVKARRAEIAEAEAVAREVLPAIPTPTFVPPMADNVSIRAAADEGREQDRVRHSR